MAKAVANLAVSLTARTKRFEKKMRSAERSLFAFNRQVAAGARAAIRFGTVALGAAGAGLVALTRSSMKSIDAIAKTSDKLTIATENLAGLQLAAQKAGVEVRTFDMGIQRMTRRIAEAALGTGEAKAAIKELGLDAKALSLEDVGEQFIQLSEALAKVEKGGDRVRLGFKVFDSEGVALINLSKQGREGLEAMIEKAKLLGIAFSRDTAMPVERANDSLTDLWASIKGLGNTLAFKFADSITKTVTKLTAFVVWIRTSSSSLKEFVIQTAKLGAKTIGIATGFAATILIGTQVLKFFELVRKAYVSVTKAAILFKAISGPKAWATVAAGLVLAAAAFVAVDTASASIGDDLGDIEKRLEESIDGLSKFTKGAEDAADAANKLSDAKKRFSVREQSARGRAEALGVQAAQFELSVRTPGELFKNELTKLNQFFRAGFISSESYGRGVEKLNQALEDATGVTAKRAAAEERLGRLVDRGKSIFDATRTPMEKFREELAELAKLLGGMFIDFDTWQRAVKDAEDRFEAAAQTRTSPTFQEVDLGRVAIGGASAGKKVQKVSDPAMLAATKENTQAIKNINTGLVD